MWEAEKNVVRLTEDLKLQINALKLDLDSARKEEEHVY
jgi:hypothetical protein